MAVYAIGDIQGCYGPLRALLERLDFDPARDRLWFTGDIVNRGPESLEALRFVHGLGDAARTVLGNHDLHMLAVWHGAARLKRGDSVQPVFDAPDGPELLEWLCRQPLLHEADEAPGYALVHAGLPPAWDIARARSGAREVEACLRGPQRQAYFDNLYGDEPSRWDPDLAGWDRLRYITNALTRMRFCDRAGRLLFDYKGSPASAPQGYTPWFAVPGRRPAGTRLVCGHWSTLGMHTEEDVLAIDTGCLWGGALTAVRLDDGVESVTTLPCEAAMEPATDV